MSRKILVTCAMPYANGDLHLGHMLEYIQTDIWVRFQKTLGNKCYFICSDDSHGTAIMLHAKKKNIKPKELIYHIKKKHIYDLKKFKIDFDIYSCTHTKINKINVEKIYKILTYKGFIYCKKIKQLFDPIKKIFLSDRLILGNCPKCNANKQYGDMCEFCGITYKPFDLINPISVLTGIKPIKKYSNHYFFKLPYFTKFLNKWINNSGVVKNMIYNQLKSWFKVGLIEWDISRDSPYFGFKIPNLKKLKFFYVWIDATIGYLSTVQELCYKKRLDFNEIWNIKSKYEIYHFIGKDIIYFHTLFWPTILKTMNLKLPTKINCHGFVTINDKKMSKSKGTFIKAKFYEKFIEPEYLRYYFSSKINSNIEDIDINFKDFFYKINSDLIGKIINIASRCYKLINKYNKNYLSKNIENKILIKSFINIGDKIYFNYEKLDFYKVVKKILNLANQTNSYITKKSPWSLNEKKKQYIIEVCSMGLNLFRQLIIYLSPILPKLAIKVKNFLNLKTLNWKSRKKLLINHKIKKFNPLLNRIEKIPEAGFEPARQKKAGDFKSPASTNSAIRA
ncbi:Methionine--tRNA ligase [Candidatus Portiera aleyrodidarum]|uniref:Methionine--tRNA ligase n=1 Tax=Candidatus Portiera aleyrodidarum TaxID=91844 RepID=A0A8D9JVT1_9GAMM|nr:Methionine--tRNA ligase [Candidatus Portiera aleyrodidarum]